MFFTAWKLRFDKTLDNPKIFVLVDRIDLDDQIYDTFTNCGGKNIIRITSRQELEQKIYNKERGIFISTIQKFTELGNNMRIQTKISSCCQMRLIEITRVYPQ